MNVRNIYRISSLVFASLLVLNFVLITYYNYNEFAWRAQDEVTDNISDNLNNLVFSLNVYSVNESSQNWNTPVNNIQGNISLLTASTPIEQQLITQLNSSFSTLSPLLNQVNQSLTSTAKAALWNEIFNQTSAMVAVTTELSGGVNGQTNSVLQVLSFLAVSFISIMVAFLVFTYLQVFGKTIKTSEKLEQKGQLLEKLVEERTNQLKDSERMAAIGQTAGMVGHDIRNPLQAITASAYLLKEDIEAISDDKLRQNAKDNLNEIETNIFYINKIVADLQDYSRPLHPEYSEVYLSEIVHSALRTIAFPDNIRVNVDIAGSLKLRTDPTFVRRALTNLMNNAIQAMPDGGTLEVACYERDNAAVIIVADTGMGIPDEIKPKLFSPMTTTKSKGQGLGLAVAKRLVETLGGTIEFESEVGKGTKFIIKLPSALE